MSKIFSSQQKNALTNVLKKTMPLFLFFCFSTSSFSQIRQNLNNLSPTARTELVTLMREYITKDIIENHCSSKSDGHTMDIHNDDNFLPFHRCYIEAMEDFLIKKGHPEYVPLPSWPPNTPVPTEFRVVDSDCSSAVCDIGVSGSTSTNCATPTNWNPNIARPRYLSLPIQAGNNNDLCDFIVEGNAQNSITRILEGQATNVVNSNYHNSVHGTMAGAMGYFTSPSLPLFWCFHAYVDDVWKEFQCNCPNKGGKTLDLYMKDSPRVTAVTRDAGNEPNTDAGAMNTSTDIWVRNQNDGKVNFVNQNPIYSTLNYVYVRVRNRGCQASAGNEKLLLHWSKAGTDQTWPTYWNGSITTPVIMGDTISDITIPSIPAGGSLIFEIQWFPPNSANYSSNPTPKLFSLLARIVAVNDPMSTAEGSNVTTNVRNNNNIVMKNVTVDSPPNVFPVVNITTPVGGAQYIAPASITIKANASDYDGSISKVEFYNGATLLETVTSIPYTYSWNNVGAGTYTLTAKAYDDLNAVTTSSDVSITVKNNTLPVVNISAPVEGAVYLDPATVTITATASDADGSISKVEFYNGPSLIGTTTTSPYNYNWSNVTAGVYSVTAKAYDDLNAATTSTAVNITVNTNNPPTVSITAPLDGTTLIAPANVTIKATATDSDGSIAKVEFYNGTTLLGTSVTSPYSYVMNAPSAGVYNLTAKAYDDLNAVKTSSVVKLTINNNSVPTVSLTAPSDGTILIAPASVTLKATANDSDGSISKVEFYNGSTLLGEDASSPYSFDWIGIAAGIYTLTAKAIDDLNAVKTSDQVVITVNVNKLPTVTIISPPDGTNLIAPGATTLKATATDPDGSIVKVEFYNGSTLLSTTTTSPFTYSWNNIAAGTYTVTAKAYDDQNASTTSTAVTLQVAANNAPLVSITSPSTGATAIAPASFIVKVNATDSDGSISKVEVYEGATLLGTLTTSPYTFNWNNVPAGTYSLTAKAIDDLNLNTTSSTVTVTVSNNSLPTVTLTSPVHNTTAIAPATFILKANASDSDGSISKVEFYEGTTLLGTSTTSPYTYSWNNVPSGTYVLTAKAVDDQNAVKTSAANTVIVKENSLPTVSITSPVTGATAISPASFVIKANASDSDGSISKVEFYNGNTLLGTTTTSPYTYNWNNVAAGVYILTAIAYDDLNAPTVSADVKVTISTNGLPTVTITSPVSGATAVAPANIAIKATASDSDGNISKVEFYQGTTLLGTDNTNPFSFDWNNVAAGTYTLTAKAVDDLNATTVSSAVTITVNSNTLPTVQITEPANGASYISPASFTIKANAEDADGTISYVEFYDGSVLLGTDNTSPYTFDWSNIGAGNYTLTAKAVDNLNAVVTSSEVKITVTGNTHPAVTITYPSNNESFISPARIIIEANASDSDGSISKVEFYNGTTLLGTDATSTTSPYTFDWANIGVGNYTLTVKAYDNLNAVSTSTEVKISVKDNSLPLVNITLPQNGSTFVSPVNVKLTADASDVDGTISKIEFYNGTTLVGTANTVPFTYEWTGTPIGDYNITAKAIDNLGAFNFSDTISFKVVSNSAPTAVITEPVNGTTLISPASTVIKVTATDSDGSISKVQFYEGATLLGEDATSPFTFDWNSISIGTHTITATAIDDLNTSTVSAPVSVTVKENEVPSASITSPVSGTSFIAPATILIKATATDNDGSVTKVEFYNGTTLLGEDNSSPFTFNWTAVSAGNYTLTVKVVDDQNASATSAGITITVNNNSIPAVSITSPTNGATAIALANFTIKATATDSDGSISKVEFYNGTDLLGTSTTSPYTFDWTSVGKGTYSLTAKAYDDLNAVNTSTSITITVKDNNLPTVSIVTPANGTTAISPATVSIKANAADSDGSISKVEFYNGSNLLHTSTTSPYAYDWSNVPAGTYTLTVKAIDDLNAVTTSSPVTITLKDNVSPTVVIVSPSNGATGIAPASVIIKANATDSDGNVSKVEFYNGSNLLGTDASSPYSFDWNNIPVGTYTLTAKAFDDLNAVTTSAAITLTINNNSAPSISITEPLNGETAIAPANFVIKATATDNDGSISKVEFYNGTTLLGTDATSPYTQSWNNIPTGVYLLSAKAYDDLNAVTSSSEIKVTVKDNTPPAITITSPINGTTAIAPVNFTIKTTASDSDGSISKVEFYNGTALLGTSTISPYSFDWNGVVAGIYTLTAKAYDNLNATTTSAEVKVTVNNNILPTVSIIAPTNGTVTIAPASIKIKANANDGDGSISKVEFYNGATIIGISQTSPYSFDWNGVPAGVYTLIAKAYDDLNAVTISSEIKVTVNNNKMPVVNITAPVTQSTFLAPATITLKANASDNDGSISKVEFYQGITLIGTDNSSPYSFDWNNVAAGEYILTAKAYDDLNGVTTSDNVKINVVTNLPPIVSITSPANGASFMPHGSITITASASDPNGTISKVEFYQGSTLLGSATTSPYSFNWSMAPVGEYKLTAKAIDNLNAYTISDTVKITVMENMEPMVMITKPYDDEYFNVPANVIILAHAHDDDDMVEKVEFYRNGILLGTDYASPYEFQWNNAPAGKYDLTAIAYDHMGASGKSPVVPITIVDNILPVVQITNPVNGDVFAAPATIAIKANASDPSGSIKWVDFYNKNALIGSDSISPYELNWNNIAEGDYALVAQAHDNLNAIKFSDTVFVKVVTNTAPTVSITYPADGAKFISGADITINANAHDNGSIQRVEFYKGNVLIASDSSAPYSCMWKNVSEGHHELTAKAYDNQGTYTISSVIKIMVSNNKLPVVMIMSPANNAILTGPTDVAIEVHAEDSDGSIKHVDFYNGNVLIGSDSTVPYVFQWKNIALGTYTITAMAYDNLDAHKESSAVTIKIEANQLPTVSITSPGNGASFTAPADVTITAEAQDTDGNVVRVDFYRGNALIGSDSTQPYSYTWKNVAEGAYVLTAKAYDNRNAIGTSAEVKITVDDIPTGIEIQEAELTGMALYPVPFSSRLTLNFKTSGGGPVSIRIYSEIGKEIFSLDKTIAPGEQTIDMDTDHLSNGVYFFIMKVNERLLKKKILKMDLN